MNRPEGVRETFSKSDRILKRADFRRVYDEGRKVQAKYFTAFVLPTASQPPRLGITTTRKFGKAVRRNRARRLVREVFRRNKWLVPPGIDIVINVKQPLLEAGYGELEGDFRDFLKKVGSR